MSHYLSVRALCSDERLDQKDYKFLASIPVCSTPSVFMPTCLLGPLSYEDNKEPQVMTEPWWSG